MLVSRNLRHPFHLATVFLMVEGELLLFVWQAADPFVWLYFIAYVPVVFGTCLTGGWGVAEWWQNRYDARKLRKQTEAFLYDQQSFHSEGGN